MRSPEGQGLQQSVAPAASLGGHVLACSGALGDPTGGFLATAEAALDGSARRSDPALPAHVTRSRRQEDLGVEMPHSTVCCLSAFEIGVRESGREGGGTSLFP